MKLFFQVVRSFFITPKIIPQKLCEHIVDICEEYIKKEEDK